MFSRWHKNLGTKTLCLLTDLFHWYITFYILPIVIDTHFFYTKLTALPSTTFRNIKNMEFHLSFVMLYQALFNIMYPGKFGDAYFYPHLICGTDVYVNDKITS